MKRRKKNHNPQEYIFGVNPIVEAIKAGRRKIFGITIKNGPTGKQISVLVDLAKRHSVRIEHATIDKIAKLANAEGHQGTVALVSTPSYSSFDKLLDRAMAKPKSGLPSLVLLDGIMDPRNLGAIIRSAEAFGMDGVIFPEKKAASYTPVAAKASAGAGEHMSLCPVTNIAQSVQKLIDDGFFCIAMDSGAKDDLKLSKAQPVAIVLGGEGTGIRPLVLKRCHKAYRIPIAGKVGSLNVSAAAAIAFHVVAQARGNK